MARPECCGVSMRKKGRSRTGKQIWHCLTCKRWPTDPDKPRLSPYRLRLVRSNPSWSIAWTAEGLPARRREDGRWIVYLGQKHPWADKAGNCYLYRYIVMDALSRKIRPDEHVHHITEDLDDNLNLEHLELVLAEYHGSLHAYHTTIASPSQLSQHVEAAKPYGTRAVQRYRAIIGPAATKT